LFDAPYSLALRAGQENSVDKLAKHIIVVIIPQVSSELRGLLAGIGEK